MATATTTAIHLLAASANATTCFDILFSHWLFRRPEQELVQDVPAFANNAADSVRLNLLPEETSTVLKEPIGDERNERLFYKLLIDNNMEDLLPVVYIPTELEFIHKSSSIVGYRPNIFSTTLSHLIATNSYHFLIPFIPIRDKLEEFFNCQYELFVEFTALIRWSRGASIGWHSDDNRPYLKQRHFAVVCYLNNYGKDFNGGLFRFQDGQPMSIMPMAGDVLIYTADQHNIHSVDEIDGDNASH
ncbi:hypothetical protein Ahy_B08g093281 isoform D [Arachis hypogaea]|uniref:Prolyl 4-hydroxylase alpha subunit Fe(2+) 2OG dioxygenase domain-containing protein n=1 Tax=Arachis hypogaea TaxID=3818 RepID=A0A444Y5P8_ARAHY|nr:hypothetical protein Ahy_B08g093281 isoform D [Arachis hypogaea]